MVSEYTKTTHWMEATSVRKALTSVGSMGFIIAKSHMVAKAPNAAATSTHHLAPNRADCPGVNRALRPTTDSIRPIIGGSIRVSTG